jgi:hypothetical protein
MKPVAFIIIVILIGLFLRECIHELPIYSLQVKGEAWESSDFRVPKYSNSPKIGGRVYFSKEIKIPHKYKLARDNYIVYVSFNPKDEHWAVNLQISALLKLNKEKLRVESIWRGNCGVSHLFNSGSFEEEVYRQMYLIDSFSTGFVWEAGTESCTAENASKYPIELKIFYRDNLIGEEKVDFEIFRNGKILYIVTV